MITATFVIERFEYAIRRHGLTRSIFYCCEEVCNDTISNQLRRKACQNVLLGRVLIFAEYDGRSRYVFDIAPARRLWLIRVFKVLFEFGNLHIGN